MDYVCDRCKKQVPVLDRTEHDDWHMAQDLQAQEQGGSSTQNTAPPPSIPSDSKPAQSSYAPPPGPPPATNGDSKHNYAPPSAPFPSTNGDSKQDYDRPPPDPPRTYQPPRNNNVNAGFATRHHTNQVIEAAKVRARDEQEMQQTLQNLQFQYKIYNSDIEPEHETEYFCDCPIHRYQRMKYNRIGVQNMWSKAVMYPGEKSYTDNPNQSVIFSNNPYRTQVTSPYGYNPVYQSNAWNTRGYYSAMQRPIPSYHKQSIHQTIRLNNQLNAVAQREIDAREPPINIWTEGNAPVGGDLDTSMAQTNLNEKPRDENGFPIDKKDSSQHDTQQSLPGQTEKTSKFAGFKKAIGIKTAEEKAVAKVEKLNSKGRQLRNEILAEEEGRWPDNHWRQIVMEYQQKVGMGKKIAHLRSHQPIQYLHLLRAGYFEPIPVAWATSNSNPLKFSIEAAAGWRGLTPAWRGYEDTAEERLYWVLNHREGSVGMRMKPDFISEMDMARARMATAVEPPPQYFSNDDTCHVQHTSAGYSRQVMPRPLQQIDRPEKASDDTMILLDVSGSMDFDPLRPVYEQYMVTGYAPSTQPKNKDVAKAIIRRFTDAMANHDHDFRGYDMVTFSNEAHFIGTVNHKNLSSKWNNVRIGGGTRVMTGWQKIKELHFEKHSASAVHHPIYGWQAGPETPILRLLLLLDGEATDMDEFELDLLGSSWAHVTIFHRIGVDSCPHHHRHANELSRISDANHHVSFVDAVGNMPERFVTHELLKRHLGYDISYQEFSSMEELPSYSAT